MSFCHASVASVTLQQLAAIRPFPWQTAAHRQAMGHRGDNNDFYPLSFNKIREIMQNMPDNPNFVGNRASWMAFRVLKYAIDMRLCGQERTKTSLN
jgi:hypothetical protein